MAYFEGTIYIKSLAFKEENGSVFYLPGQINAFTHLLELQDMLKLWSNLGEWR